MGSDFLSSFAPWVDSAERFATAARTYLQDAARAAPAAAEAARVFSDCLREQSTDFFPLPWSAEFGAGTANAAPPASLFNMPALGVTREHQQRWQRTADAGRRIDDAQRRLRRLWSDALRDAAAAFATRLAPTQATAPSGDAPRTDDVLRELYDSWIDCAEEAYARTAHSESFCNALAEFVNASSLWRRELQASMEHFAKLFDLPTRSELNTLTQRLKSVEEQLRAERTSQVARHKATRARSTRSTRQPKP